MRSINQVLLLCFLRQLWKPIEGWLGMEGKLNRENMKLLLSVATEAQIYMAMIQVNCGIIRDL